MSIFERTVFGRNHIFDARRDGSESDRSLAQRPRFVCMYKILIPMTVFERTVFGRNHIWS